jgi:hypothetical protein
MLRWSSGLAATLIVLSFLAAHFLAAQFEAEAAQKSRRHAPAAEQDANTQDSKPADKTQAAGTKDAPPVSDRAVTGISAGKDAKSGNKSEPAPWKPEEITAAKARCDAILKTIDAVAVPEPPIKEGKCGTPAPIRVSRLGKANPVSFDPPALMQCDLAEALSRWLEKDVQPLAIKHLGAPVAKLEIMSDYSCRTSAGRVHNRLSEHAFADALDIGAFVTAKGKAVSVLALWGKTNRDMIAEAEAEAAKALAEAQAKSAAAKSAEAKEADAKQADASEAKAGAGWATTQKPAAADAASSAKSPDQRTAAARKKASPSLKLAAAKLGGPATGKSAKRTDGKSADPKASNPKITAALAPPSPATPTARFLHESHAAACKIFGTTLGPEANEDHRNHFHVDMAERKYKKICD